MSEKLYIGVDGGATKCIVRVENAAGELLGRESSGCANIRISPTQAWESIFLALNKILQPLQISLQDKKRFYVGMGLAGCEIEEAYQAFMNVEKEFATLKVTSDAHTACLGAHNGLDGAIIIAGTGVVGFQVQHGHTNKIGGWGFPHDDIGGGAWIGLQAMSQTLQSLDGRLSPSSLTTAIYNHFKQNHNAMVSWANQANSTAFAELAPMVIAQAKAGEPLAENILKHAAKAIDQMNCALINAQSNPQEILPCTFIGGVAPFVEPYLSDALRSRLRPAFATPDAGAVMLVRASQSTAIF